MIFEPDFEPPQVQTRKALLALDLQNDFLSKDAKIAVDDADLVLARIAGLAAAFRKEGDVVWVNTEYQGHRETISSDTGSYTVLIPRFLPRFDDETDEEESAVPSPTTIPNYSEADREAFLADFGDTSIQRCCLPDTHGSEMPEAIKSAIDQRRDLVITKSDYSAFAGGSLLMTLRTNLVTELFLCGSLSHISVYATAIDAIRHGFSLTIVEDCVSHGNVLCHDEALRQMSDLMGAEMLTSSEIITMPNQDSVEAQEPVRDDHFLVQNPVAKGSSDSLTFRPRIEDWVKDVIHDVPESRSAFADIVREPSRKSSKSSKSTSPKLSKAESRDDLHLRRTVSHPSPSMKRTADDVRKKKGERQSTIDVSDLSSTSSEIPPRQIDARPTRRRRHTVNKEDEEDRLMYNNDGQEELAQSRPRDPNKKGKESSPPHPSQPNTTLGDPSVNPQRSPSFSAETYGEGDCYVLHDLLGKSALDGLFEKLRKEVQWQKMYHRSGEVPRLVAVQGQVQDDGTIPIYRHPADESPPLRPFSPTVDIIREHVQRSVGIHFNHVLIQLYRNGEDNISEHSDKTLDIERDTNIVNYSVGAQRTMILRTKKAYAKSPSHVKGTKDHSQSTSRFTDKDSTNEASSNSRTIQRITLPNDSLFVLGQTTNSSWLHSIRADKRRTEEKTSEELAFGGERISLTFRCIATFINSRKNLIWGQGATSKIAEAPSTIISNDANENEKLIVAFGQENHQAGDFDWEKTYGNGFDVVNFTTTKADEQIENKCGPNISSRHVHSESPIQASSKPRSTEFVSIFNLCIDAVANSRIKLVLTETTTPFMVSAPMGTRLQPEVLTRPRNDDGNEHISKEDTLIRLVGYENIVSHFQPTSSKTCSMDPRTESILKSWQESKFSFDPRTEFPDAIFKIIHLIHEREQHPTHSPSCSTTTSFVSSFDRDLFCLLHDITLRLGTGLQGLASLNPSLKQFYETLASNELFKKALGPDIRRVIN
ncbi:putative isochorismatase family protein family [Phaeomoniella chlamydospora]|uniref:Putative isochorismatase family protein family n=1 Tax=Phaeomoniella chlamydospora TaxID=158046 RepID=A0A0G2EZ52_PHACM|nr:putative isochorismatase family protein family [Phaeomoniella chlamydospora]